MIIVDRSKSPNIPSIRENQSLWHLSSSYQINIFVIYSFSIPLQLLSSGISALDGWGLDIHTFQPIPE